MIIGYARVSTKGQAEGLRTQEAALRAAGCERIFTDTASGAKATRPGLDAAVDYVRDGDTIMVTKLDRLGRTMLDTLRTLKALDERGVRVKAQDLDLDTGTPAGKLVVHVIAALAEWERDTIIERTQAGVQAARKRGRKPGPKPSLSPEQADAARAMLAGGMGATEVGRVYGVSRWTIQRLREHSKN